MYANTEESAGENEISEIGCSRKMSRSASWVQRKNSLFTDFVVFLYFFMPYSLLVLLNNSRNLMLFSFTSGAGS
jgi:hypothetical protein